MALVEFLLQQLEAVGQVAALAQGLGHLADMAGAFVHGLEQALEGLGESLVTIRAAQAAGLLEIGLGEAAARAFELRAAARLARFPATRPSPSSRSASEKPVGSLTPLVLAHSSHRSTFCILSPAIWVRCTVASFSLQMQHNIILYSYIGSPDTLVKAWYWATSLCVTGPGLPVPITRPSILTTGTNSAPVPVRKHSSALNKS